MNPTLFFSLSVDFIPDMQDGRQSFIEKMKETATLYQSPFSFDAKDRPTIEKITSANLLKILPTLDLSAFGTWPSCILTCTIQSNHTVYSIGTIRRINLFKNLLPKSDLIHLEIPY